MKTLDHHSSPYIGSGLSDSGYPAALILPHQLRMAENVPMHGLFHRRFGRSAQIRQNRIQRLQLEKIAVTSHGRARPPITHALPIIYP